MASRRCNRGCMSPEARQGGAKPGRCYGHLTCPPRPVNNRSAENARASGRRKSVEAASKESRMREVFVCDAARTAIGRYAGALAKVRTDDLAAVPIRALVARNPQADWSRLDEVFFGCANQAGEDNRNVARMALLLAGLPDTVPGVTVNRLCASGLNAVG